MKTMTFFFFYLERWNPKCQSYLHTNSHQIIHRPHKMFSGPFLSISFFRYYRKLVVCGSQKLCLWKSLWLNSTNVLRNTTRRNYFCCFSVKTESTMSTLHKYTRIKYITTCPIDSKYFWHFSRNQRFITNPLIIFKLIYIKYNTY